MLSCYLYITHVFNVFDAHTVHSRFYMNLSSNLLIANFLDAHLNQFIPVCRNDSWSGLRLMAYHTPDRKGGLPRTVQRIRFVLRPTERNPLATLSIVFPEIATQAEQLWEDTTEKRRFFGRTMGQARGRQIHCQSTGYKGKRMDEEIRGHDFL